ncbi:hypothetical protein U9M48_014534, partial [Paspalum notatum var. saurae]
MFARLGLKCTALRCRDRPDLELEVLPKLDEILHGITSAVYLRNPKLSVPSHFICPITQSLASGEGKNDSVVPDRTQFNNDDFPVQYDAAKFFVIKSYREDDIHMSIKYDVWASTTNGNKLDAAYQEAQSKGSA